MKFTNSLNKTQKERNLSDCGSCFLYHVHRAQFRLWLFRQSYRKGNNLPNKNGKVLYNVDKSVSTEIQTFSLQFYETFLVLSTVKRQQKKKKCLNLISNSEKYSLLDLSAFLPLYNPSSMSDVCSFQRKLSYGQSWQPELNKRSNQIYISVTKFTQRTDFITYHLPGLERNWMKPSYSVSMPCYQLQEFCCPAEKNYS